MLLDGNTNNNNISYLLYYPLHNASQRSLYVSSLIYYMPTTVSPPSSPSTWGTKNAGTWSPLLQDSSPLSPESKLCDTCVPGRTDLLLKTRPLLEGRPDQRAVQDLPLAGYGDTEVLPVALSHCPGHTSSPSLILERKLRSSLWPEGTPRTPLALCPTSLLTDG